jgi:hypothetical protein
MKAIFGLLGVFFFTIGGALLFYQLSTVLAGNIFYIESFSAFVGYGVSSLLLGLGLWVIVLCGKPDTKQTPT